MSASTRNGWTMLVIPAVAEEDTDHRIGPHPGDVYQRRAGELLLPERETQEDLDRVRRELGSVNYSAQYQQRPIPPGGAIIKRNWIQHFDQELRRFDAKIVSWDTASTLGKNSDYSVCTVWGRRKRDFHLLNVIRGRFELPELQRRVVEVHRAEGADKTVIEKTDIGRALWHNLRDANLLSPLLRPPRLEKQARLLKEAPKFEEGRVWLPREAPWLATYLSELLGFPNTRHDDQVDSTTQALRELTLRSPRANTDATNQDYGPTGRRTRASLTRLSQKPLPEPEDDDDDDAVDEGPTEPIVRHVDAYYEVPEDRPRPRRAR